MVQYKHVCRLWPSLMKDRHTAVALFGGPRTAVTVCDSRARYFCGMPMYRV